MSGIVELQQRVAAVEQQFGLANEQRTKYSARLLSLMDAVETRLREQQAEIGRQADELAQRAAELTELTARSDRGEGENEQLRGMLHSLLQAIESGGRDVLCEAMQTLETKVSSLVSDVAEMPAEADPQPDIEPATQVTEANPEEAAAADEPASAAEPIEEPSDEPTEPDAAVAEEAAAESAEAESDDADEPTPETADAGSDIADEAVAEAADADTAEVGSEVSDEAAEEPADNDPVIAEEPLVIVHEDEAAEPADSAEPEVSGETAETPADETPADETPADETPADEAVTLAAIMERVSKLLDEDEVPGAPVEPDAAAPADPTPDAEIAEAEIAEAESEPTQAVANS